MFARRRRCARHGAPAPSSRHPGRPGCPRVAQRQQRDSESVAEPDEAADLVRLVGADRTGLDHRVVGEQADGPAFDADDAVTAPAPNCGRSSSTEPVSASSPITAPDIVGARPRSGMACRGAPARRSTSPRPAPGNRTVCLACRTASARPREDVHHADAACIPAGPTSLRADHPEARTLDHHRPAHADARIGRRDDHVAAAEQGGIAGEGAARGDADERTRPLSLAKCQNVGMARFGLPI